MKKTTLALSALALSLGLALSPLSATAAETSSATTAQQMPSLAPMLEKVMPSVVSINVEGSTTVNTPRMPRNFQQFFGDDSPFCQEGSPFQSSPFCQGGQGGNGGGQQQKFMALGSGVIIDADKGYVVTNNHVVDNATVIKVQLSDGRKFDAKMVGKDPRSDIALIQIQNPKNLTAIKMADSDALRVGDYTVAIGNPFGLGETVTSGIVSALGRSGLNAENYENFIQTDAAINRGNSGGALVNLNGELIGINTAILAPDGGNIGIGFAIPVSYTHLDVYKRQVLGTAFGMVAVELFPQYHLEAGTFAIAGMGALLAASIRAPLTGIILVLEMTDNYQLILPMIITGLGATLLAQFTGGKPLYSAILARTLAKQEAEQLARSKAASASENT